MGLFSAVVGVGVVIIICIIIGALCTPKGQAIGGAIILIAIVIWWPKLLWAIGVIIPLAIISHLKEKKSSYYPFVICLLPLLLLIIGLWLSTSKSL